MKSIRFGATAYLIAVVDHVELRLELVVVHPVVQERQSRGVLAGLAKRHLVTGKTSMASMSRSRQSEDRAELHTDASIDRTHGKHGIKLKKGSRACCRNVKIGNASQRSVIVTSELETQARGRRFAGVHRSKR
jgi:hypothetical protein